MASVASAFAISIGSLSTSCLGGAALLALHVKQAKKLEQKDREKAALVKEVEGKGKTLLPNMPRQFSLKRREEVEANKSSILSNIAALETKAAEHTERYESIKSHVSELPKLMSLNRKQVEHLTNKHAEKEQQMRKQVEEVASMHADQNEQIQVIFQQLEAFKEVALMAEEMQQNIQQLEEQANATCNHLADFADKLAAQDAQIQLLRQSSQEVQALKNRLVTVEDILDSSPTIKCWQGLRSLILFQKKQASK